MERPKPHPANVPGDFYVEDGCCTMCEVPLFEAPELFGGFGASEGISHCYVKRQPESGAELERMIKTIQCAELGCIRYRGTDPVVQSRLAEVGELRVCDEPLSEYRPWWTQLAGWWRDRAHKRR